MPGSGLKPILNLAINVSKYRDSYSELCNVFSGVPQGSVLGPLLHVRHLYQ